MLSQLMGTLLFFVGIVMVIVAALSTVVPVSTFGDAERALLFIAGVVTLSLGYMMVSGFRLGER